MKGFFENQKKDVLGQRLLFCIRGESEKRKVLNQTQFQISVVLQNLNSENSFGRKMKLKKFPQPAALRLIIFYNLEKKN